MKIKRIITLILMTILFVILASMFTVSSAVTSKWFNAKSIYRDNYSYQADEKTIWRLYETSSSSNNPKNGEQTIFCLHRGVGLRF